MSRETIRANKRKPKNAMTKSSNALFISIYKPMETITESQGSHAESKSPFSEFSEGFISESVLCSLKIFMIKIERGVREMFVNEK